MMSLRAHLFVAIVGAASSLAACGGSVQHAQLSPPPATPPPPAPIPRSLMSGLAKRYVVHANRSSFSVFGSDVVSGAHRLSFDQWRAYVTTEPGLALHVEIDTASVQAEAPFLTSLARNELLEADRFPRATLSGTLRVVDERAGTVVIEGIADLHGVRQGIRISGTLKRHGDDFRLHVDFAVSRRAFSIHARPAWDPFIKDDVRVVVDALVIPEGVDLEPSSEHAPERSPESLPAEEDEPQRSKQ